MIDSHCHLADETFSADLDEVIRRARDAGLERAMVILEAGNAKVSWSASISPGVTGYRIYGASGSNGRFRLLGSSLAGSGDSLVPLADAKADIVTYVVTALRGRAGRETESKFSEEAQLRLR